MSPFARDPKAQLRAAREGLAAFLPVLRDLLLARSGGTEVDAFGKSPRLREQLQPFLDWLYERWLRVEARGFEQLPSLGPLLLVSNRAGLFPWDALLLAEACRRHGRELRPLVEDKLFFLPYLGLLANRLGVVRASPENALQVLEAGGAVAAFPEGSTGYESGRRLERFGRGGFVRLALRGRATVLPVAISGPDEATPLVEGVPWAAAGLPLRLPHLPWLGPLGPLPRPAPWRIRMGRPMDWSAHPPEAAEDESLVLALRDETKQRIQDLLSPEQA